MAKKKSVKLSAKKFEAEAENISTFVQQVSTGQTQEHESWLYDYAVIRLYKALEDLMLDVLVGAVNNDTSTLASTTDVKFPKHLTDEVCEFLITGTGYFDFKGRSGLIRTLKSFVPENHYLVTTVKKNIYAEALNQLTALRNFSAHGSQTAKRAALDAVQCKKLSTSGAWLKRQDRFTRLVTSLKKLSSELSNNAPY